MEKEKNEKIAADSLLQSQHLNKDKSDNDDSENKLKTKLNKNSLLVLKKESPKAFKKMSVKESSSSGTEPTQEQLEQFRRPFEHGWKREIVHRSIVSKDNVRSDVYYRTPDGKKMRSMPMVIEYLRECSSDLDKNCFTFSKFRVYEEPEETERDAKPIVKGLNNLSASQSKQTPSIKDLKKKETKRVNKRKKVKEAASLDAEKSVDEDFELLNSLEGTLEEPTTSQKASENNQTLSLKHEKTSATKKNPHKKVKSNVIKESPKKINKRKISKEDAKDASTSEEGTSPQKPSKKRTLFPIVSKTDKPLIKTSVNNKKTKSVLKEVAPKKTPMPTYVSQDYMSQVDKLVDSTMSYEEKLKAIRDLARRSLTKLEESSRVSVVEKEEEEEEEEEDVVVSEEVEEDHGSECDLFSNEELPEEGSHGAFDEVSPNAEDENHKKNDKENLISSEKITIIPEEQLQNKQSDTETAKQSSPKAPAPKSNKTSSKRTRSSSQHESPSIDEALPSKRLRLR